MLAFVSVREMVEPSATAEIHETARGGRRTRSSARWKRQVYGHYRSELTLIIRSQRPTAQQPQHDIQRQDGDGTDGDAVKDRDLVEPVALVEDGRVGMTRGSHGDGMRSLRALKGNEMRRWMGSNIHEAQRIARVEASFLSRRDCLVDAY